MFDGHYLLIDNVSRQVHPLIKVVANNIRDSGGTFVTRDIVT